MLTTGLSAEGRYSEHLGICRRTELPGRSVKVKEWKVDEGLIRDDSKITMIIMVVISVMPVSPARVSALPFTRSAIMYACTHTSKHTHIHTHKHTHTHKECNEG